MSVFYKKLRQFSRWDYALPCLLLLAILLHCGTSINGGFYADDYFQRSYVVGSPALEEKGLLTGIHLGSLQDFSKNQFLFFDAKNANYESMLTFGVLPWYINEETKLHFYRPLSALFHYFEYRFFPDNPSLMHTISLLFYLLGLMFIYALYRVLDIPKSVALMAMLLLILDNSIFHVLSWIAGRNMLLVIAFGFAAIYAYHRGVNQKTWYLASLALLLCSLLAGEGGVGICAYLGSYMLVLDTRPWLRRFMALLPFIAITVLWRLYYQSQGYGAFATEFYIDPGHSPMQFLQRASWQLSGNFFELFAGIDTLTGQVREDIRHRFSYAGIVIAALLLLLLRKPLAENRNLQFFALASFLSLIPGLAVILSSRVMILPNIGLAIILAVLFQQLLNGAYHGFQKIIAWILVSYSIFMHIFIGFLLATYITISTAGLLDDNDMARGNVQLGIDDFANKYLIVLNAKKPFWLPFLAFELDFNDQELPASLRVMSSSFYDMKVERISEKTLTLTGLPALQLDAESLMDMSDMPAGHYAYLSQRLMGLFRKNDMPWSLGLQRDYNDISINLTELISSNGANDKPKKVMITLKKPLEEYRFVYWDKDSDSYQPFQLPEVNETVYIDGIFTLPDNL